jgi:hypothetical protein
MEGCRSPGAPKVVRTTRRLPELILGTARTTAVATVGYDDKEPLCVEPIR